MKTFQEHCGQVTVQYRTFNNTHAGSEAGVRPQAAADASLQRPQRPHMLSDKEHRHT